MIVVRCLFCLWWLMLFATTAFAGDEESVVMLEEYGIMVNITENFDRIPTVTAQCLLPQTQPLIWQVLSSYEDLDEIVPAITVSRVVGEERRAKILYQEGHAGMWFVDREFTVTFRVRERPLYTVEFEAIDGSFRRFVGTWRLKPMRDGTLVTHSVEIEPDFWAPKWALKRIARRLMAETMRGVVARCYDTAGRNPDASEEREGVEAVE
jgi:ribosome-associated toxin RatA of RatAB toxin-antitoxin module